MRAEIKLCCLSIGIHFNTQGSLVNFRKCYNGLKKIKKPNERYNDNYAFTFTMDLRCSRGSDQKDDTINFSSIWHNVGVDLVTLEILFFFCLDFMAPEPRRNQDMANNISLFHHAKIHSSHYSDVIWALWSLKSLKTWLFVHQFIRLTTKKTPKLRITGFFWGDSTVSTGVLMIPIELPVHDVIMHVNTRRNGTTTFFSTAVYHMMTYYLIGLPSALLLWHTNNLPTHPFDIGILLSHQDALVSHPTDIETILLLVSLRKSSEISTLFIS